MLPQCPPDSPGAPPGSRPADCNGTCGPHSPPPRDMTDAGVRRGRCGHRWGLSLRRPRPLARSQPHGVGTFVLCASFSQGRAGRGAGAAARADCLRPPALLAPEERPALGEGTRVRGSSSSFTPIPSLSPAALSVISFLGERMSSVRSPVLGAFCTLSASGDAGLVPGGGTSAEQWCCRPESVSWEHIPAGWASVLSSQTFAFCPHVT